MPTYRITKYTETYAVVDVTSDAEDEEGIYEKIDEGAYNDLFDEATEELYSTNYDVEEQ
ncbi:hypothetical protein SEA_NICEHOUSE_191 [Rhodococcus phage NiceHouse]|nr:hypothetical protein SEA_NICEHOUSE_191 [Rhodococcus phage NiceHouse]